LSGYQRAFELTVSGWLVDVSEAKSLGIVLEVVEPDHLLSRVGELAARFATQPPKALRLTKRLMKVAQRLELPDFLDLCVVSQSLCHNDPAHLDRGRAALATQRLTDAEDSTTCYSEPVG